jgi:hypothetical protein
MSPGGVGRPRRQKAAYHGLVSEHDREKPALASGSGLRLEDLAEQQQAQVVDDLEELRADVWASDEELDAFLADLRVCRDASVG